MDILHEVDATDCSLILKLRIRTLRSEAKRGKIDSAAVLAVHYGQSEIIEKLSINNNDAQQILSLIAYGRTYQDYPLAGLTDSDLNKQALEGNPEASYQLYWKKATPDPHLWLCHAADLGHHQARHRLGVLYWYGAEGIKQDYLQSYKWHALAARTGNYESWKEVRRIKSEVLNSEDVMRADMLVRSWNRGQCEQELIPQITGK